MATTTRPRDAKTVVMVNLLILAAVMTLMNQSVQAVVDVTVSSFIVCELLVVR